MGSGVLVTIKNVIQEDVALEGEPEKLRWCMYFQETEKPLVLNPTNGQLIAQILKSDESDNWIGHKIVLYDDPSVSFGGRLTGGIRVRAPKNQASKPVFQTPPPAAAPTTQLPTEPEDENSPF